MTNSQTSKGHRAPDWLAIVCLVCTGLVSAWASYDDRKQLISLSLLKPVLDWVTPIGAILEQKTLIILAWLQHSLVSLAALIAIFYLIYRKRVPLRAAVTLLAFISALYAQVELVLSHISLGILFYTVSALLLASLYGVRAGPVEKSESEPKPLRLPEMMCFGLIFIAALILRFYALNRIFDYFEGEETPFAIAGTDIGSMSLANIGYGGPWSPFGYIYFFLVYIPTNLFGTTLLSLRLGAAVPGMLMLLLVFLFTRNIFSRTAAFVASLILTIDSKQVSWARYEFPHGSTALTAILITWLTYHSFKSKHLGLPLLLTLCMGLCFHQYPSGQTAFLIPWFYMIYLIIFHRDQSHSFYAVRFAFLVCGTLLWYFGASIPQYFVYGEWRAPAYLTRFDTRVSWRAVSGQPWLEQALMLGSMYGQNIIDYFASLSQHVRIPPPPQDHIPSYGYLPIRTTFLAVPPLALITLGFFVRNPGWKQGALIFSWVLASLLPCILSNEAAPRRAATSFPALMCAAGAGYALIRTYACSLFGAFGRISLPLLETACACALVLASLHQWFSGQTMRYGEPGEMQIIRQIQQVAEPGSIIVLDLEDHYMIGRLTYLMLDFLNDPRNRPIVWLTFQAPTASDLEGLIKNPGTAVHMAKTSLMYRWSGLRYHESEHLNYAGWRKMIYVGEHFPNSDRATNFRERTEIVRATCVDRKEFDYLNNPRYYHHFYITTCAIP